MSYSSNYTNRTSIFDNGDTIDGDHVKALYDELGEDPGDIFAGIGIPYRSGSWWNAARTFTSASTTTAGLLSLWPMVLVRTTSFDRISTYVDTTAGSASTVVRMGIYNSDSNGMPSTLVANSEVTQDGTVVNSASVAGESITVSLGRGRYYLAAVSQGSGTMPTTSRGSTGHFSVHAGGSTTFNEIMGASSTILAVSGVTGSLTDFTSGTSWVQRTVGHSVAVRMA